MYTRTPRAGIAAWIIVSAVASGVLPGCDSGGEPTSSTTGTGGGGGDGGAGGNGGGGGDGGSGAASGTGGSGASTGAGGEDPYTWLEDATSPESLEWVQETNQATLDALAEGEPFTSLYDDHYRERTKEPPLRCIPEPDGFVYQFKQDATNPRGVWRRTPAEACLAEAPAWDVLLDVDQLATEEDEDWVYAGSDCYYNDTDLCLISLSRGGKDAIVIREFDKTTRSFVTDGFVLPEAKSYVAWSDEDTLLLAHGADEDSLTTSGYPRQVKIWRRGTPLSEAKLVFEAEKDTVLSAGATVHDVDGSSLRIITSYVDFYHADSYVLGSDDVPVKIEVPQDATIWDLFQGKLLVRLASDWSVSGATLKSGSLAAVSPADAESTAELVYAPDERSAFVGLTKSREGILVTQLHDVAAEVLSFTSTDSGWTSKPVPIPPLGDVDVTADPRMDEAYVTFRTFLQPTTVYQVRPEGDTYEVTEISASPALFDASPFEVSQDTATSKDGTKVPYFVVKRAGTAADGESPTLLYGYGGFEHTLPPFYLGLTGKHWLEKGGVYVLANIRGGGEFGPAWHQAAILENKQRSYDDFIAIAEDLIAKGITSPAHLAIQGGSNGGLLVGAVTMQRPDLFGAVSCQVPLLDMLRYHEIGAGASWMGEYGDPEDPEMAEIIRAYSPYHNIEAGVEYPPILFTTTTTDDRVHPAHARKMAARLKEMNIPFYFYEGEKGGHAGSADPETYAFLQALNTTYLYRVFETQ
ncbi:prolyl oligopeptidase family serine peptidase [Sorangium sp. So ce1099]|uniref:prolyl oligopeptidase family serine peptidase n=1 Tax=Sorangium sp. So ce1099 TaxID=3133331 RepID=UPI003F5D9DDD